MSIDYLTTIAADRPLTQSLSAGRPNEARLQQSLLRVPLGTGYRSWWLIVPLVVAGLTGLLGLALLGRGRPAGLGVVAASVCCALVALVTAVWIRRRRRWLEIREDRCRVLTRDGGWEFGDGQVVGLTTSRRPHYRHGRLRSLTETATLWIERDAQTETLTLQNRVRRPGFNALEPWLDRLQERLHRRAEHDLLQRKPVSGNDWQMFHDHLRVGQPPRESVVWLDDLAAVESIDEQLCLWQRAESRPSIAIPLTGRNAWLLERLLRARVWGDGAVDEIGGLGRVLFERRAGWGVRAALGALALLVMLSAIVLTSVAVRRPDAVIVCVAIALGLFGLLFLLLWWNSLRSVFRCHEHGLCKIGLFSTRQVRFSDVRLFAYRAMRQYMKGAYVGTLFQILIRTSNESGGRELHYAVTRPNADPELDTLRDRVAQVVAAILARELAATGSVQWTPQLRLTREGIEYSRRRLLGGPRPPVVVPYDSINEFGLLDDRFYVWTNFQERAILREDPSQPNFYPGLALLERLLGKAPIC